MCDSIIFPLSTKKKDKPYFLFAICGDLIDTLTIIVMIT